jgi:spore coat protein U-like protein
MKKFFVAVALIALLAGLGFAQENTATDYMTVYALNVGVVALKTMNLYFGQFIAGGETIEAQTTVYVNVAKGTPFDLAANAGQNYANTWRQIKPTKLNDLVRYGLYKTTGGEWGDNDHENTYPYGSSIKGTGSGATQAITISGRLFAGDKMDSPLGWYYDVVTVTLYY